MKDQRGSHGGLESAPPEFQERALCRVKERLEDDARRPSREGPKLRRQREHDVEVTDVEHSLPTGLYPGFLGQRLTLRTMPIATRVVRRVLAPAGLAAVDVPTQPRGAALGDVGQDTLLGAAQSSDPLEPGAMSTHDVGDVEARWAPTGPAHRLTSVVAATGPAGWASVEPASRSRGCSERSTGGWRDRAALRPRARRYLARAGGSRSCDEARA